MHILLIILLNIMIYTKETSCPIICPHFMLNIHLSDLFQLTQSLIRKLTPTIDKIHVWWYISNGEIVVNCHVYNTCRQRY